MCLECAVQGEEIILLNCKLWEEMKHKGVGK